MRSADTRGSLLSPELQQLAQAADAAQQRSQASAEEVRGLKDQRAHGDKLMQVVQRKYDEQEKRVQAAEEKARRAEERASKAEEENRAVQTLIRQLEGKVSGLVSQRGTTHDELEQQIKQLQLTHQSATTLEKERLEQEKAIKAMTQHMRRLEQKQEENVTLSCSLSEKQSRYASGVAHLETELERDREARKEFESSSAACFEKLCGVDAIAEDSREAVVELERRLERRLADVELKLTSSDRDFMKSKSFPARMFFLQNRESQSGLAVKDAMARPPFMSANSTAHAERRERSAYPRRGLMHLHGSA